MDRTRHSFATTSSHGGGGGGGGSKAGGLDAVRRAVNKAHYGVDESSYSTGASRSQQSSRAASLNTSKILDMQLAGIVGGPHGIGQQEAAWGVAMGLQPNDSRLEQPQQHGRGTAQLFGRQNAPSRGGGAVGDIYGVSVLQNRSSSQIAALPANGGGGKANSKKASSAMSSDAVTPSINRGSSTHFEAGFVGGFGGSSAAHQQSGVEETGGRVEDNNDENGARRSSNWPVESEASYIGDLWKPAPTPAPLPSPRQELAWGRSKRGGGDEEEWGRHDVKEDA